MSKEEDKSLPSIKNPMAKSSGASNLKFAQVLNVDSAKATPKVRSPSPGSSSFASPISKKNHSPFMKGMNVELQTD